LSDWSCTRRAAFARALVHLDLGHLVGHRVATHHEQIRPTQHHTLLRRIGVHRGRPHARILTHQRLHLGHRVGLARRQIGHGRLEPQVVVDTMRDRHADRKSEGQKQRDGREPRNGEARPARAHRTGGGFGVHRLQLRNGGGWAQEMAIPGDRRNRRHATAPR
jgi:hypothetical protein